MLSLLRALIQCIWYLWDTSAVHWGYLGSVPGPEGEHHHYLWAISGPDTFIFLLINRIPFPTAVEFSETPQEKILSVWLVLAVRHSQHQARQLRVDSGSWVATALYK